MSEKDIFLKLNKVFDDIFDDDINLQPETAAADIDGWDSLTHIRLMLAVERAFDIKFSAAQISSLKNIGELIDVIQSKL
jgi:acyl carrier protein